ncbi:MAG: HWE histidine kinase domain-containing protein, partial [Pseudomonadota bacterium]
MKFQDTQPELTECDREPIHNIATVQPFGCLIKLNSDWVVAHRSTNCAELLGLPELPEPGTRLADIFAPRAIETLKDALLKLTGGDSVERVFGFRLTPGGALFDCALHTVGERIILECEPHAELEYADHLSLIGPVLAQLEPVRDLNSLCQKTTKLVREMLGYDRAMIYKFHADGSGEVVAEDRRDDLEAFLGMRYPRTDIPQQARELYQRNKFRVIADVDAEPSPIEPDFALAGQPLDMSMSMLRSSSQIHLQYLRNMGVAASLTIAIVRHGKLWGLIACHHTEPMLPAYSLRTVAEIFSQMFSMMIDRLLIDRSEQLRNHGRVLHDQLMQSMAGGKSLAGSLPMIDHALQDIVPHDGASVLLDGQYEARGSAPSEDQFKALTPALGSAPISTIIASNSLKDQLPDAAEFADIASGALILPISRSPRDYLVLWRKPLTKTVVWAGDPAKTIAAPGDRLQPRESFAAWEETVRDHSDDWSEDELQIAESLRVTLLEVILRMTDEVARERARAQEQQELLIAELNHRVRNILNLIRSLVAQSQHGAVNVEGFASIIGGRIAALASAHDNITRENWAPAPLSSLFETELAAYISEKKDRFVFD